MGSARTNQTKRHRAGGEDYHAYVPVQLPIEVQADAKLLEQAVLALTRLSECQVHSLDLFLYMYVRKEAALSSQIEGTQSSLNELVLLDNEPGLAAQTLDAAEVSRYVAALNHGITRLKNGFPLCVRLLKEVHRILLTGTRGQNCAPGELRRVQN